MIAAQFWSARVHSMMSRLMRFIRSPLKGKIRRFWLTHFRKGYVRDQIARRQGKCLQCGDCCKLMFRCLFLTSDQRCSRYDHGRPGNCTCFPIDERDVGVGCGYSFPPRS